MSLSILQPRRLVALAILLFMSSAGSVAQAAIDLTIEAARVVRDDVEIRDLSFDFGSGDWSLEWSGEGDSRHLQGRISQLETPSGQWRLASSWSTPGLDGRLEAGYGTALDWSVAVDGLSFDTPDGRFAAEKLKFSLAGTVPMPSPDHFDIRGRIAGGEVLLDDFYRDFSDGGLDIGFRLTLDDSRIELSQLNVTDGSALVFAGGVVLPLDEQGAPDAESVSFTVDRLELDFPLAYTRYLEPVADIWNLGGLTVTGSLRWSGEGSRGLLRSGVLEVADLAVADTEQNRFALSGLNARLKPGDYEFASHLSWNGLLFGRINLGGGTALLDSRPGYVGLAEPLDLGVLGGSIRIAELAFELPGGDTAETSPDMVLRADIDGLDIEELTSALDWPLFTGEISGEIPSVTLDDGVLTVDGEVVIEAFGGRMTMTGLGVERPFGVLPSLAAEIEVKDLDLEQLTATFSFGQIAGRLDGYVHELRMLDWKPVAFEAWLGTPESQKGSEKISRRAVNRLTAIGGGSATATLSSPLLRVFNSFSYRRLGLGCRLNNNVCTVWGLDEDQESVLLLEGAGIPKVSIRAFNRSMDWPQLLAHLVAVSGDEGIRIGD